MKNECCEQKSARLFNFTNLHCASKKTALTLTCCNLDNHQPILTMWLREKQRLQLVFKDQNMSSTENYEIRLTCVEDRANQVQRSFLRHIAVLLSFCCIYEPKSANAIDRNSVTWPVSQRRLFSVRFR